MIKIVAIKTTIVNKSCGCKTLVSLFQLVYVASTLFIISFFDDSIQQLFYTCTVVLAVLLVIRLALTWLPKTCGECSEPLEKHNRVACPECGAYNVYDLKLWSKLEFEDIAAAHKAEVGRTIQEFIALIIVLSLFTAPVAYFLL